MTALMRDAIAPIGAIVALMGAMTALIGYRAAPMRAMIAPMRATIALTSCEIRFTEGPFVPATLPRPEVVVTLDGAFCRKENYL